MTFGKRGAQHSLISHLSSRDVPSSASDDNLANLDLDLEFGEQYAPGKPLWAIVVLWLTLGWLGAHRFFLEHWLAGITVVAGPSLFVFVVFGVDPVTFVELISAKLFGSGRFMVVSGTRDVTNACLLIFAAWVFADGTYIVGRKLINR